MRFGSSYLILIHALQAWRAAGLPASLRSANVNSLDFYAVGRLLGKGAFGKAGCRSCRETDPERTMSKMVTDILIIYLIDL